MASTRQSLPHLFSEMESKDSREVVRAIETCEERLRDERLSQAEIRTVGAALSRASRHSRPEVRKAVALALQFLRDDSFLEVAVRLASDENSGVRVVADRTLSRRTKRVDTDFLQEQHAGLFEEELDALETTHGRGVRIAVARLTEKYVEAVVRETAHELVRIVNRVSTSLLAARDFREDGEIEPEVIAARLDRAIGYTKHLSSVVKAFEELGTRMKPSFADVAVREIVKEAIAFGRPRKKANVSLVIDVPRALTATVDRTRLVQALSNVVKNSFEALEKRARGRSIRIEASADGFDWVEIAVTDNGSGMSEDVRRRAWQVFYTTKLEGRGVGLPLVKRIVEGLHHGRVTISSEENEGTTVTIRIPREQEGNA